MITVHCTACSDSFLVSEDAVGQQATCPACGVSIVVAAPVEEGLEPATDDAWEYYMLVDLGKMGRVDEKKLNRMGRQGWELVSVHKDSPESHTCFYFKRRMRPDKPQ